MLQTFGEADQRTKGTGSVDWQATDNKQQVYSVIWDHSYGQIQITKRILAVEVSVVDDELFEMGRLAQLEVGELLDVCAIAPNGTTLFVLANNLPYLILTDSLQSEIWLRLIELARL